MKILVLILIFVVSTTWVNSQDKAAVVSEASRSFIGAVPKELEDKCDKFFTLIKQGKLNEAYDEILKNSPINDKKDQVDNLLKSTKKAIKSYGALNGYESVNSESVSESYIRLRYLGLHADLPMRWIFTFYKSPARGWIITQIQFDDISETFFTDQ
jgi:hypothetical protein